MQADDQQEALLAAASAGDVAHARVLLEARADPNAAPTSGGGTPLMRPSAAVKMVKRVAPIVRERPIACQILLKSCKIRCDTIR